jgi:hypothetical protein
MAGVFASILAAQENPTTRRLVNTRASVVTHLVGEVALRRVAVDTEEDMAVDTAVGTEADMAEDMALHLLSMAATVRHQDTGHLAAAEVTDPHPRVVLPLAAADTMTGRLRVAARLLLAVDGITATARPLLVQAAHAAADGHHHPGAMDRGAEAHRLVPGMTPAAHLPGLGTTAGAHRLVIDDQRAPK